MVGPFIVKNNIKICEYTSYSEVNKINQKLILKKVDNKCKIKTVACESN